MFSTMVYKKPGDVDLGEAHGGLFSISVAKTEEELASLLSSGWHRTPAQAAEAAKAETPATRPWDHGDPEYPLTVTALKEDSGAEWKRSKKGKG